MKVAGRWQLVSGQSTRLPLRPRAVAIDSRLYDDYVGQYKIGRGRNLTVTNEGGSLMGQVTARPKFELIAKSDTTFARFSEDNDYGDDEIVFVKDAGGRVTHAALRGATQEVWRAKKVK